MIREWQYPNLRAMGISVWHLRKRGEYALRDETDNSEQAASAVPGAGQDAALDRTISDPPPIFEQAGKAPEPDSSAHNAAEVDWGTLESTVKACTTCGLCEGRTQAVFGVGDQNAELMIDPCADSPGLYPYPA